MNKSILIPTLLSITITTILSACSPLESKENQDRSATEQSTQAASNTAPKQETSDTNQSVAVNPSKDVYFGETHMHTAFSLDAYLGGTRLTHEDAYRYAQGETINLMGRELKRHRPLDFIAVTDHAEYIGEMYTNLTEGAEGHNQKLLKELRGMTDIKDREAWFMKYVISSNRGTHPAHPPFFTGPESVKSAWKIMQETADRYNQPGKFTALKAFEWSGAPGGGNLHRNVIFRDAQVPDAPISYIDTNREDGLWQWMAQQEAKGMKLLAIPHNSNASKGMMFPSVDAEGKPIDLEYAQTRQHFEPLMEMMQVKGNSEVHRQFWPEDEFSDFENADSIQKNSGRTFHKKDFVREGLKMGLAYEQSLGVNPFKYGTIGGTDNHNGLPSAVAEDSFIGAHGGDDGSVKARRTGKVVGWIDGKDLSIDTLAGVWATQNTRSGLWDAMKSRETYSTTGPRIKVRFFGGVELPAKPKNGQELVQQGYDLGVPMGSDLPSIGSAPTFTVHAMKDPDGANLDRIQIIKGWVDVKGKTYEKIFDVVWSDKRKKGEDGKLTPVGNTVDLTTAKYTNTIGATALIGSWTDSEFNPEQHAFYYTRVIEIPTPRWTTYDAVRSKQPLLDDVQASIQERAWTSPIWYKPAG
ncbi:DUF3604 domain-containing protein [Shewanella sp. YLB-07]|uniref:DUF3604 domain-containing protein n=1 Tax=Shewanella sp. YLB-07 TaxID=2601268 RepID=UPI00128E0EED|nr:DUF3604 domain-containing protein [Shewanella sp. YLB-07]